MAYLIWYGTSSLVRPLRELKSSLRSLYGFSAVKLVRSTCGKSNFNAAKIVNCVYNFFLRYSGTFIKNSILSSVKICCCVCLHFASLVLVSCLIPRQGRDSKFNGSRAGSLFLAPFFSPARFARIKKYVPCSTRGNTRSEGVHFPRHAMIHVNESPCFLRSLKRVPTRAFLHASNASKEVFVAQERSLIIFCIKMAKNHAHMIKTVNF